MVVATIVLQYENEVMFTEGLTILGKDLAKALAYLYQLS